MSKYKIKSRFKLVVLMPPGKLPLVFFATCTIIIYFMTVNLQNICSFDFNENSKVTNFCSLIEILRFQSFIL